MTAMPQSLIDEAKRLEKRSREVMSPAEQVAHEKAEIRLDERFHRFNAMVARQQAGVGELVQRGSYKAARALIALHDAANAEMHF